MHVVRETASNYFFQVPFSFLSLLCPFHFLALSFLLPIPHLPTSYAVFNEDGTLAELKVGVISHMTYHMYIT